MSAAIDTKVANLKRKPGCSAIRCLNIEKKDLVKKELEKIFLTKNRDTWLEELKAKDVCIGPLNELWDVESDPQVKARDMIVEVATPHGPMKQINIPIRLSGTPGSIRTVAPRLGANNEDILKELGYSPSQIESFREDGVI